MKTALNRLLINPIVRVSAKPFIGPLPNRYNITPIMIVVMLLSKIVIQAREKP